MKDNIIGLIMFVAMLGAPIFAIFTVMHLLATGAPAGALNDCELDRYGHMDCR